MAPGSFRVAPKSFRVIPGDFSVASKNFGMAPKYFGALPCRPVPPAQQGGEPGDHFGGGSFLVAGALKEEERGGQLVAPSFPRSSAMTAPEIFFAGTSLARRACLATAVSLLKKPRSIARSASRWRRSCPS